MGHMVINHKLIALRRKERNITQREIVRTLTDKGCKLSLAHYQTMEKGNNTAIHLRSLATIAKELGFASVKDILHKAEPILGLNEIKVTELLNGVTLSWTRAVNTICNKNQISILDHVESVSYHSLVGWKNGYKAISEKGIKDLMRAIRYISGRYGIDLGDNTSPFIVGKHIYDILAQVEKLSMFEQHQLTHILAVKLENPGMVDSNRYMTLEEVYENIIELSGQVGYIRILKNGNEYNHPFSSIPEFNQFKEAMAVLVSTGESQEVYIKVRPDVWDWIKE